MCSSASLEIGRFSRSVAAGGRCFILRAMEGRQNVAQGKRGQEPLAPPWVSVPTNSSSLPPNRPPLGDLGGKVVRGGAPIQSCESRVCLSSERYAARSVVFANEPGLPPHPNPLPQHEQRVGGEGTNAEIG